VYLLEVVAKKAKWNRTIKMRILKHRNSNASAGINM